MKRSHVAAILCSTLSVLACSSSKSVGDEYFESRLYVDAATAYQAYLDNEPRDARRVARSLYRLGVIYALPESPLYDPERAAEILDRLLRINPGGPYSSEAELIRHLQLEVVKTRDELAMVRQQIEELRGELEAAELELEQTQAELGEGAEQVETLSEQIASLRGRIEVLSGKLAAKEQELERLKAIDLQQPP